MNQEFIYFSGKDLRGDIGQIDQNQVKPFFSEGKWSMHDLMLYLLEVTGPARVWLSTFSISEEAIRSFAIALEKGRITRIHCLFDYTIQKNKLGLLFFAYNTVSDITIGANHSKLLLLQNDSWKISVVGSANFTPNPRKEAGVIFSTPQTFDHYLGHLQKAFEEGTQLIF